MKRFIVEWTVGGHKFIKDFDTLELAKMKMIQLDAFGIKPVLIIRGI